MWVRRHCTCCTCGLHSPVPSDKTRGRPPRREGNRRGRWTAALTSRVQEEPWKKTRATWEFKRWRQIAGVLCEEEAGRGCFWGTGNEEEFSTLMRRRREKPSAQVSKGQGETETERVQSPGPLPAARLGTRGASPGEEAESPAREGRAEHWGPNFTGRLQRTKSRCRRGRAQLNRKHRCNAPKYKS